MLAEVLTTALFSKDSAEEACAKGKQPSGRKSPREKVTPCLDALDDRHLQEPGLACSVLRRGLLHVQALGPA